MKKYLLSCLLLAIVSTSFGQTTKEKIDQLKKDPKTTENAAKADVHVIDKKNISDGISTITTNKKKKTGCKARKQKTITQ